MDQELDFTGSARDTDAYPGGVALMYLDEPIGALTAEQVAFLLGNDPVFITALLEEDEEQAEQWAADALAARTGNPDPLLVEASGGKDGLAEACLHEARAWAMSVHAKRAALDFLAAHPRPVVPCPVADEMDRVQTLAEQVSEVRGICEDGCGPGIEGCPRHRGELSRWEAACTAAVHEMRGTLTRRLKSADERRQQT